MQRVLCARKQEKNVQADSQPVGYFRKNYILFTLMVLFVVGMTYGALIVRSQSVIMFERLSIFTSGYTTTNRTSIQMIAETFASGFIFVFFAYVFGFSAISQVVTVFIPMFKGLGLGLTMGYLYTSLGIKGVGYSLLIIVPQTIFCMFAVFIACRESVKLSNLFLHNIRHPGVVSCEAIKLYTIKFMVLLVFILVSAIVRVISVAMFADILKI